MQMHMYQDGRTFPEDINMLDGTCMIKYLYGRVCQPTSRTRGDGPKVANGDMLAKEWYARCLHYEGRLNSPHE